MSRFAWTVLGLSVLGLCVLLTSGCGSDTETPEGLKIVLSHGNNSRPYMPWPESVANQVAGALESVGFEVEVRQEEWSSYLKMVKNGEHQMALLGWSADYPDADNFLYVLLDKSNAVVGSANNISFYTSEEVHTRLEMYASRLAQVAAMFLSERVPITALARRGNAYAQNCQVCPPSVTAK